MERDLIIVILATSVGTAGLLLVFFGFVFSVYSSYHFGSYPSILLKYRILLWLVIIVFTVCTINSILALCWLINLGIPDLILLCLFVVTILGVMTVAIATFAVLLQR
jgi:hypothetical protein